MPVVDFTDVESFSVIDAGVYGATVAKAVLQKAKTGSPMIVLTLAIEDEPFIGRKVFQNLVLVPTALWKVKATMVAFGWAEDDLEGEVDIDPEDFLDLACRVRVDVRQYQGEDRNNVEAILPADVDDFELEDAIPF